MSDKIKSLKIEISAKSFKMLEDLSFLGIYGATTSEVACRFIDQELQRRVEKSDG